MRDSSDFVFTIYTVPDALDRAFGLRDSLRFSLDDNPTFSKQVLGSGTFAVRQGFGVILIVGFELAKEVCYVLQSFEVPNQSFNFGVRVAALPLQPIEP